MTKIDLQIIFGAKRESNMKTTTSGWRFYSGGHGGLTVFKVSCFLNIAYFLKIGGESS